MAGQTAQRQSVPIIPDLCFLVDKGGLGSCEKHLHDTEVEAHFFFQSVFFQNL